MTSQAIFFADFERLLILERFLDRHQPGPIRSVLLVIIGWLVTQFSQKRL